MTWCFLLDQGEQVQHLPVRQLRPKAMHSRFKGFAPWTRILEGRTTSEADQAGFGEYTLYTVTAFELIPERPPVRACQETHALQLHSRHAFDIARFQAPIVHITDKEISLDEIADRAALYGKDMRPAKKDGISDN